MPAFRYQSLTSAGQTVTGTVAAPDRQAAIRQIVARGETPTNVQDSDEAPAAKSGQPVFAFSFRKKKPTLKRTETAALFRELATAVEAGLPLATALRTVRKQASHAGMEAILDHLIDRIEAGTPFHQAAREYGAPFDDMIVGMLRASDASGETAQVLEQLSDLLDRSVELRRSIVGAMIYPMILLVLVVASAVLLITYLVPRLLAPLEGQIQMPLPTRILLGLAEFLGNWWVWLLIALVGGFFAARAWLKVPENKTRFDGFMLRIPVVGTVLRDVAVARFTRTLGTLASAGLPILESLRITRDTLVNRALMRAIDDVAEQVTAGRPLAEPLEKSGLFPPLLVQIVNLGERSGRLESMLLHAAGAFDKQVNNSIRIFTATLQPLLVVIMALVGAFVLAAILLPLLELQNFIGG